LTTAVIGAVYPPSDKTFETNYSIEAEMNGESYKMDMLQETRVMKPMLLRSCIKVTDYWEVAETKQLSYAKMKNLPSDHSRKSKKVK